MKKIWIRCEKCNVFTTNIRKHNSRKRCMAVQERRSTR
jgi:hypothetical protein